MSCSKFATAEAAAPAAVAAPLTLRALQLKVSKSAESNGGNPAGLMPQPMPAMAGAASMPAGGTSGDGVGCGAQGWCEGRLYTWSLNAIGYAGNKIGAKRAEALHSLLYPQQPEATMPVGSGLCKQPAKPSTSSISLRKRKCPDSVPRTSKHTRAHYCCCTIHPIPSSRSRHSLLLFRAEISMVRKLQHKTACLRTRAWTIACARTQQVLNIGSGRRTHNACSACRSSPFRHNSCSRTRQTFRNRIGPSSKKCLPISAQKIRHACS
jgi:hypothetical protein